MHWRVYSRRTLLAVSGPAVIQALSGGQELDKQDLDKVREVMGGASRARLGDDEILEDDDIGAFARRARLLLTDAPRGFSVAHLYRTHRVLGERVRHATAVVTPTADLAATAHFRHFLPPNYETSVRGTLLIGSGSDAGKPVFIGLVSGDAVGAEACWLMADQLIKIRESARASAVVLMLHASGHAATRQDESLMLSAYLAHLAVTAGSLAQAGIKRSVLWITGQAAGAVYVAFAAPVETVSAVPNARIRILPEAAVQQILGVATSTADDANTWIRTGVADAVLDMRLATANHP
jgi:hypothetical protein